MSHQNVNKPSDFIGNVKNTSFKAKASEDTTPGCELMNGFLNVLAAANISKNGLYKKDAETVLISPGQQCERLRSPDWFQFQTVPEPTIQKQVGGGCVTVTQMTQNIPDYLDK